MTRLSSPLFVLSLVVVVGIFALVILGRAVSPEVWTLAGLILGGHVAGIGGAGSASSERPEGMPADAAA